MSTDAPTAISLQPQALHIEWPDAHRALSAPMLRAACRCTHCRSAALRGRPVEGEGAELVDATPIGHYAVQLRFADGHERGIYPWAYLLELAEAG
jgi:DUF971 family protein